MEGKGGRGERHDNPPSHFSRPVCPTEKEGGGSGRERAVEVSAVRQRQAAFEVGQVWK